MASLNLSLDDMIKNRRNRQRGGRGQGRAHRGRGGSGGSLRSLRCGSSTRRRSLRILGHQPFAVAKGSAGVLFARRSDAVQALWRHNNVQSDAKPMKIEIVGTNVEVTVSACVNVVGGNGRRRTVVKKPGPGRTRGPAAVNRGVGSRGGFRGGHGRGVGGHDRGGGGGGGGDGGRGRKSAVVT